MPLWPTKWIKRNIRAEPFLSLVSCKGEMAIPQLLNKTSSSDLPITSLFQRSEPPTVLLSLCLQTQPAESYFKMNNLI